MKGWAQGVLKQSGNHTALNGSNKLLTILHYDIISLSSPLPLFFLPPFFVNQVPSSLKSVIYTFSFMVSLEKNRQGLKGSNSAFWKVEGKGGREWLHECLWKSRLVHTALPWFITAREGAYATTMSPWQATSWPWWRGLFCRFAKGSTVSRSTWSYSVLVHIID